MFFNLCNSHVSFFSICSAAVVGVLAALACSQEFLQCYHKTGTRTFVQHMDLKRLYFRPPRTSALTIERDACLLQ